MSNFTITRTDDYLMHHGVKGQKWGIRRYQNPDGSLTQEGKNKYGAQQGWEARQMYKQGTITKEQKKQATKAGNIIGKLDNYTSFGFGRRLREFQDRHKKGLMAANIGLTAIGGLAATALTAATGGLAPAIAIGSQAIATTLGSAVGTLLNYKVINPLMLKYGYNSKITSEGFKPTKPDYNKNQG